MHQPAASFCLQMCSVCGEQDKTLYRLLTFGSPMVTVTLSIIQADVFLPVLKTPKAVAAAVV